MESQRAVLTVQEKVERDLRECRNRSLGNGMKELPSTLDILRILSSLDRTWDVRAIIWSLLLFNRRSPFHVDLHAVLTLKRNYPAGLTNRFFLAIKH